MGYFGEGEACVVVVLEGGCSGGEDGGGQRSGPGAEVGDFVAGGHFWGGCLGEVEERGGVRWEGGESLVRFWTRRRIEREERH